MIHSFESILFKGLIKPVGKPVNRFVNQFEWFIQFPAARADSFEAVLTQMVVTESLRTSRAAGRDLFQEECLCLFFIQYFFTLTICNYSDFYFYLSKYFYKYFYFNLSTVFGHSTHLCSKASQT